MGAYLEVAGTVNVWLHDWPLVTNLESHDYTPAGSGGGVHRFGRIVGNATRIRAHRRPGDSCVSWLSQLRGFVPMGVSVMPIVNA
jgi:hypothetical protein